MTVALLWPDDLVPYRVAFYLQAHRGGSESPLSRVGKYYALSAPRWVARLTFRGGYDGTEDAAEFGPRLDALLADLEGIAPVKFWDFRRPGPLRPRQIADGSIVTHAAADQGATSMTLHGFMPGTIAFSVGDYVGGDGRPHIVTAPAFANGAGDATISFKPPLRAAIAPGSVAVIEKAWGVFRFPPEAADDAGMNETEVGAATEYQLSFVEDLTYAA